MSTTTFSRLAHLTPLVAACLIAFSNLALSAPASEPVSPPDTAKSGGSQFVFGTTSYFEVRQAAPAVSQSLESTPEDALALGKAGQSGQLDQVHALLIKHGFTEEQLKGLAIEVRSVKSPRDAASGQATGKRQHAPLSGGDTAGNAPTAQKIKVTITASIKPPKLIITITW